MPDTASAAFLSRLDAAIGCQQCGGPLGSSPSDDFCTPEHQRAWHEQHTEQLTAYRDPWFDCGDERLPGVGTDAMNTGVPEAGWSPYDFCIPQRYVAGLSHDEAQRFRSDVMWRDPVTPTRANLTAINGWVECHVGTTAWQLLGSVDRDTGQTFTRDEHGYEFGGMIPGPTMRTVHVQHGCDTWPAVHALFAGVEPTAVIYDEAHRMPRHVRHPGMASRTRWVGGRGRRGRGGPRR